MIERHTAPPSSTWMLAVYGCYEGFCVRVGRREYVVRLFAFRSPRQASVGSHHVDTEPALSEVEASTALGDLLGRLYRLPKEQRDLVLGPARLDVRGEPLKPDE